jgi:hypothetical protein
MAKSDCEKGCRDDRDQRNSRDRCDKVDAHHLDLHYTSSDDETKNNDETKNKYVNDDDASKSTASSNADDNNFAVAIKMPAKNANKGRRGSAITNKEVIVVRKRKPDAVTVLRKEKRTKVSKKIIESDSDKDDDDNFLVSCDKALDHDPLNI